MIPRLVFLLEIPANPADKDRFGFEQLRSAGVIPEIWDLSPIYFPHATSIEFSPPVGIDAHLVRSTSELDALVQSLTSQDTILLIGASTESRIWRWRECLKIIFASQARITALAFGAVPNVYLEPQVMAWGNRQIRRARTVVTRPHVISEQLFRRWERLLVRLPRLRARVLPVWALDHIWVGTFAEEISPLIVSERTAVKYIHELDYDLVLRESPRNPDECNYMVFLGFGGQDADLLRIDHYLEPEKRAETLARFFDKLESLTGHPIVIASHPRARPGRFEPFFGGRPVIYHETARLISQASLVLSSNDSTAISMVVAFQRPMMMISSSHFEPAQSRVCQMMERLLGVTSLSADGSIDHFEWPEVDQALYTAYFERYVKRPGTPETAFWRVVAADIHAANLTPVGDGKKSPTGE